MTYKDQLEEIVTLQESSLANERALIREIIHATIDIIQTVISSFLLLFNSEYRKQIWLAIFSVLLLLPIISRTVLLFYPSYVQVTFGLSGFFYANPLVLIIETAVIVLAMTPAFGILLYLTKKIIYKGNKDIPTKNWYQKLISGGEISLVFGFIIVFCSAIISFLFGGYVQVINEMLVSSGVPLTIKTENRATAIFLCYYIVPLVLLTYMRKESLGELLSLKSNLKLLLTSYYSKLAVATMISGPLVFFLIDQISISFGFQGFFHTVLSAISFVLFLLISPFLIIAANVPCDMDTKDGRKCFCDFTTQTKLSDYE